MITDGFGATEDDISSKELLQEIYDNGQDSSELTRLTEMVRSHYLNYLEKQLQENLINCNYNTKQNGTHKDDYNEMCTKSIKKTAELLEDKAVKACMIAKFYQRAMVKIIAIVRRTTQEKRIFSHLEKCIQTKVDCKPTICSKETQTEGGLRVEVLGCNQESSYNESFDVNSSDCNTDDKNIVSLDEKIEMFKKHLQKEKCINIGKTRNSKQKKFRRDQNHHIECHSKRAVHRNREERHTKQKPEVYFSPTPSIASIPTTPISPTPEQPVIDSSVAEKNPPIVDINENSNDSVGLELARIFSEEKTELDEIFGIDPNDEPDDPQICKILKEIDEAIILDAHISSITAVQSNIEKPQPEPIQEPSKVHEQGIDLSLSKDLSKSIWPCELFMQRRKLSESLARLIDEDLRWHDIIKWRFSELFGEDSDDEFSPCSPSIELDEVLAGSCIRRISPWVVKYLMKPMRDGLIGNRFLFKKLAKNLARSIIMENQYPDETIIEECVENFFCLHQAVMCLEDLDANIPNISTSF